MKNFLTARPMALAFMLALLGALAGAQGASAQALNWSADTSFTLGVNTYTILSGSAATSMVVGTTSLTVTVPGGSTFTLQSPVGYLLNNDLGLAQTCSVTSQLVITGAATVIVTPDTGHTCTSGGGGGGGGGQFDSSRYGCYGNDGV